MKTLNEYITERKKLMDSEIQLERAGLLDEVRYLYNKRKDEITWHIGFLKKKSKRKPSPPLYPLQPNENFDII